MNPIYDFSAGDHAVMLGDQIRLELYRRAICNQVKPDSVVAEIGTGTGILSAYAATQTKASVTAIEFAEYSAKLATDMMKSAGFRHVNVLRAKSTDVLLDPQPSILITETIGALGPEENIVELCLDFKRRHPKIAKIIPAKLRIFAEPIRSKRVLENEKGFYEAYASASFGTFDFNAIRVDLAKIWSSRIRYDALNEAVSVGPRVQVVEYVLGETEVSSFATEIQVGDCDAIHLYFEAELDSETILSSHFSDPETHWGNAYVSKPSGASTLVVSYDSPAIDVHQTLMANWK